MKSSETPGWNKSLMELTNTFLGFFQRTGISKGAVVLAHDTFPDSS